MEEQKEIKKEKDKEIEDDNVGVWQGSVSPVQGRWLSPSSPVSSTNYDHITPLDEHVYVLLAFCEIEVEYLVMLGIIHTCTALRYKPAFIAIQ